MLFESLRLLCQAPLAEPETLDFRSFFASGNFRQRQ